MELAIKAQQYTKKVEVPMSPFIDVSWDCCHQALPRNVAMHRRVDDCVHILVALKRCRGIKTGHRLGPQLEKDVDVGGGKFCTTIEKVS